MTSEVVNVSIQEDGKVVIIDELVYFKPRVTIISTPKSTNSFYKLYMEKLKDD